MLRCVLALATVALLGGTAHAYMPHLKCTCGQDGTSLPRDGAVNVPTNARVWRLYRDTQPSGGPLPWLQPQTAYDLSWYHVSFTTGDGPDHEPPAKPQIGAFTITVTGGSPQDRTDVGQLFISSGFSADTAVLRIRLFDAGRVITYYMPADRQLICEPGFALHAGPIDAEITAIDLAGNESPPAGFMATSTLVTPFASSCPRPELDHHDHSYAQDDRMTAVAACWPLGVDLVVSVVVLMGLNRRSRTRTRASIEPLAITAAELLARRMRLLSTLTALALVAAVAMLAPLDVRVASALALLSPLFLWALVAALASWWTATRLLRLAAHDGAVTTVRHDLVEVALPDRGASLACPRRLIVRAQQNALPKATSL